MSKQSYIEKMRPYAIKASNGTGLPVELILAQWGHETGWGTSSVSKRANNHGGIKYTSHADYQSGAYAGYNSLNSFVQDYIRVMNLSYYKDVRAAGSLEEKVTALDKSPYAEDPRYGEKLMNILSSMSNIQIRDFNVVQQAKDKVSDMSQDELVKMATIGAGALLLISLVND
jgi:flagellum-specific peptidoglycan hydrolase FlgJ